MSTSPLIDNLPAGSPAGPSWLQHLRQEAASRLREDGFPTVKTEAWRFTPVRSLIAKDFAPTAAGDAEAARWAAERLSFDGCDTVVLVNGVPATELNASAGVSVQSLRSALDSEPDAVQPHLGRYASAEHFGALNAAMFSDGVVVRVDRGSQVERPLHIVHVADRSGELSACYPRTVVVAEEASELTVVESYLVRGEGENLVSAVTEVAVGPAAVVDHTRIIWGEERAHHIASVGARVERGGQYRSRKVTLGGTLSRVDLGIALAGEGAEAVLDGVYHASSGEHVANYTKVDHQVARTNSNEIYKGLLDGTGYAVFDGQVYVRRDAQQIAAHQQNHNILLSDGATVHTKPHLEIDADDVICSHGATVGALDDSMLFYLRARGLPREDAEALLTYAFVREVIERIPTAAVRQAVTALLIERLPFAGATIEPEAA